MKKQSEKTEKSRKFSALAPAAEPITAAVLDKPKRGRPKTSPHDSATQNRLRVQRHRDAKRQGEEIPVEVYLPKTWHGWITEDEGANLREAALEAFALWLKSKGYPAEAVAGSAPPSKAS